MIPVHEIIFYAFTVLLIASATMVITAKNSVTSVLFLVLSFFASACLWMLMQAEFLSLVLIFVYVGAVMTLFLFVVMMLRTDDTGPRSSILRHLPWCLSVFIVLVGTILYALSSHHWAPSATLPTPEPAHYNNVVEMGTLLFTKYLLAFEMCAVLLLVGMIAAITLAFHGRRPDTKTQSISAQIAANKKDRLTLVDLKNKKTGEGK